MANLERWVAKFEIRVIRIGGYVREISGQVREIDNLKVGYKVPTPALRVRILTLSEDHEISDIS